MLMFRVLDLAGVSLTPNPFRSSDVKKGEGMVKSAGKEVRDAYPTTTYKNCLINAPAASIAGALAWSRDASRDGAEGEGRLSPRLSPRRARERRGSRSSLSLCREEALRCGADPG